MTKSMTRRIIFTIMVITILVSFQQSYASPEIGDKVLVAFENAETAAIPDWVKTTMGFYLDEQISEREILDAFNYLFEHNIMHLSQEAAQEVNDLRAKVSEQEAAISSLRTIVSSQGMSDDSGKFWTEDLQPGYYENSIGERIMQPEFGGADSTQSKVIVRGWDPEQKEPVNSEANKESVQRFVVEMYSQSMHSSQGTIWLPMIEGDVLTGFEDGDPDRPIIIGRIYNAETSNSGDHSGEFWFENLPPGESQIGEDGDIIITGGYSGSKLFGFTSQTIDEILKKGGTVSAWEEGIAAFSQHGLRESVIPELAGIVVLCNNEIDKKTLQVDAELKIIEQWLEIISEKQQSETYDASERISSDSAKELEVKYNQSDLDFISRKLIAIDQQIQGLSTGVKTFEQKLSSVGDDAQLANIDLQNVLQKQQQTLQTISNVSKMQHDSMMSIINNMR